MNVCPYSAHESYRIDQLATMWVVVKWVGGWRVLYEAETREGCEQYLADLECRRTAWIRSEPIAAGGGA